MVALGVSSSSDVGCCYGVAVVQPVAEFWVGVEVDVDSVGAVDHDDDRSVEGGRVSAPSDVEVELVSVRGCDAFACGVDACSGMLGCGGVEYLSGAVEVPGGGGCSHDHFGDDEPGGGCTGAWGQVEHSRGGEQSAGLNSSGCGGGCQRCPQQVFGVTGTLCLADTGEHGLTGTDEVAEFSRPPPATA